MKLNRKTQRFVKKSWKMIDNAIKILKDATMEKPLILFTDEQVEECSDGIYDYPYGYFITKHGFYVQGNAMQVHNGEVTLFLTGEDWGDLHVLPINEMPVESIIGLVDFL